MTSKPNLNHPYGLPVERLNAGEPILSPTHHWWETGVTFNPAAIYLDPSPVNWPVIRALLPMLPPDDPRLAEGVVAVHYRARPEVDPGSDFVRSFIGLAVFTPALELLYRYQEPVLAPSADLSGYDVYGVEDPRVQRFGDTFYMVYCGVQANPLYTWRANLCLATSRDLLHWEKQGVMTGDIGQYNNKDGVFFPEPIDGRYYLLHRPFAIGWPHSENVIRLAVSDSLRGPWIDLGEVLRAYPNPRMRASWVGAGSVPIPVGEGRYIEIFHTGNYLNETDREYDVDAVLLDFNRFDPCDPSSLVAARLQPLMVPETPAELRSRSQLQVGNVLFVCGSYEYQGWIYLIYGGADTYTLAARVEKAVLLAGLAEAGLRNPFA